MPKRTVDDRRITRAGRKIAEYIRLGKVNISALAESSGVTRQAIYRLINGQHWQNITVDLALALMAAIDNGLKVEDFQSKTAEVMTEANHRRVRRPKPWFRR